MDSNITDKTNERLLKNLFEYVTSQPSIAPLQCNSNTKSLKGLHYLRYFLENRLISSFSINCKNPTIADLLQIFSALHLVRLNKDIFTFSKYTQEHVSINLYFAHYVKQAQCACALRTLLMYQLHNYGQITKDYLFSACKVVIKFAFRSHGTDFEPIGHCIAFCEMLGFDTRGIRCFINMKQFLKCQDSRQAPLNVEVENMLLQLLKDKQNFMGKRFHLEEFTSIMAIRPIKETYLMQYEFLVMQYYATKDEYWRLLIQLQYFDIDFEHVKKLSKVFKNHIMGNHIIRAFSGETTATSFTDRRRPCRNKRHSKMCKQKQTSSSIETINIFTAPAHSPILTVSVEKYESSQYLSTCCDAAADLFAYILTYTRGTKKIRVSLGLATFIKIIKTEKRATRSQMELVTQSLRTVVEYRWPVMAILEAFFCGQNEQDVGYCWLIWLTVTTKKWHSLIRMVGESKQQQFPWNLLNTLVADGSIAVVLHSFEIFYPHNALNYLFRFIYMIKQKLFSNDTVDELQSYCLVWSKDNISLPFNQRLPRMNLMKSVVTLLLLHLERSFDSATDQRKFLGYVCKSGLSDIAGLLDFRQLKEICDVLQSAGSDFSQKFCPKFTKLLHVNGPSFEYERILSCLISEKLYETGLLLASLIQKPIGEIVYSKWVREFELKMLAYSHQGDHIEFLFAGYEEEVLQHSLPPETLVNFLLFAASNLPLKAYRSRYYILQKALKVINHHRLFPNETFDRDQIEYDMIVNYLCYEENDKSLSLPIYHSEYYEEIMLAERCVLYKSFIELKELTGINELNINSKIELNIIHKSRLNFLLQRLLDDCDIVEALRLQELFNVRPIDLRFVVFCMILAESISTPYCMSSNEHQHRGDVQNSTSSKFTLYSGLTSSGGSYLSGCYSTQACEEISLKEKQYILAVLKGVGSKLRHGVDIVKRIISCYRAAMYLGKDYVDVLRTKDVHLLLQSIAEEGCMHRLLIVSDILTSSRMKSQEIAELLAFEITTAVVRPRFYIFNPSYQAMLIFHNADLWGYNMDRDLHLFLELTSNRTKLGSCLLEYCDALKIYRKYQNGKSYSSNIYFERLANIIAIYGMPVTPNVRLGTPQVLSHKKQNLIYVELLIKSHQSFVHECSMEGIAIVVNRAKALNNILAQAKSWSVIVRMLTGIGRYPEMFFCFETLIKNAQFESLLNQFDKNESNGLQQAIQVYLRDNCQPKQGKELFKLAAVHFVMYKDLAVLWEQDVQETLNNIFLSAGISDENVPPRLRCTVEVLSILNPALEYTIHAAKMFLLDNKLLLAQKCAFRAELIAMQIDIVTNALENPPFVDGHFVSYCVIQIESPEHLKSLITNKLRPSQALIMGRAYNFDINWSECLLFQFVLQTKRNYLSEFLQQVNVSDDLIQNTIKRFQMYSQQNLITNQMDHIIAPLVHVVSSITLKYTLASVIAMKSTIVSLIDSDNIYYLRDVNFGQKDESLTK